MNPVIQALLQLFNENLGNRLTGTLAKGILLEIEAVIRQQEEEAKKESSSE